METHSNTLFINEQQSLEMKDCLQNPLNSNFPDNVRNSQLMGSSYLPLFQRFLIQYPEVHTTAQMYKVYAQEKCIWEILEFNEREKIVQIFKEQNVISDEKIIILLNAITVHFLFMEPLNELKNDLIKNIFQEIEIAREESKLLIKLKKKFKTNINKYTDEFISLLKFVKFPARKPVSPTINLLLMMMVETAQESNIKSHYSEFLIPSLKHLKKEFPLQFREIKSFAKIDLMKRVARARLKAKSADDSK